MITHVLNYTALYTLEYVDLSTRFGQKLTSHSNAGAFLVYLFLCINDHNKRICKCGLYANIRNYGTLF